MKFRSSGICVYKTIDIYSDVEILLIIPKGHSEFSFIKGKIEQNETEEEAALRESNEETNISFEIKHLEQRFYQCNKQKNISIFIIDICNVNLNNIILQEKEVQEIKFFKLTDDIDINKNQKDILTQIRNKLILRFNK